MKRRSNAGRHMSMTPAMQRSVYTAKSILFEEPADLLLRMNAAPVKMRASMLYDISSTVLNDRSASYAATSASRKKVMRGMITADIPASLLMISFLLNTYPPIIADIKRPIRSSGT